MISSDMIRSTLDLVILDVVAEEPSYGYAISQKIQDYSDGKYIAKETTLYAAIRRLEQRGDLRSFPGQVSAGRQRTYYEVTEQGQQQHQELKQQWFSGSAAVNRILQKGTRDESGH